MVAVRGQVVHAEDTANISFQERPKGSKDVFGRCSQNPAVPARAIAVATDVRNVLDVVREASVAANLWRGSPLATKARPICPRKQARHPVNDICFGALELESAVPQRQPMSRLQPSAEKGSTNGGSSWNTLTSESVR